MAEEYVLLSTLAQEWGIDKSNARKYVLKHGFDFTRVRGDDPSHQAVLSLSASDAELIREIRSQEGYRSGDDAARPMENGIGVLYVVQMVPELDPLRVKLGYASDVERRLMSYRTICPTAVVAKTWMCRPSWEKAAIDSLAADGCTLIGGEVYQCSSIDGLLQRGNVFFSCMPSLVAEKLLESV